MTIRPIRSEQDYQAALAEVARLMDLDPAEGSDDLDTLDVLATLVEAYETVTHPIEALDPVEAITARMTEYGLTPRQLATKAGIAESKVSEVLNYKRPLSIGMIRSIGAALDLPSAILMEAYPLRTHA